MPRRRLGVVLLVPPPRSEAVDGLRRAFGDPALDRVAPHITLIPPVNVAEADLDQVLAILRRAAAQAQPLDLAIGPVEAFPGVDGVVYLAVDGAAGERARLDRLRRHLRSGPLDRPIDHEFVPHVTIAQGLDPARLATVLEASTGWRPQAVGVERLHLLEEQHTPAGRRWRPIADVDLAPAHIVGRGGLELELTPSELLDPQVRAALVDTGRLDEIDQVLRAEWQGERALAVVARHAGAVVGVLAGSVWGDGAARPEAWLDPSAVDLDLRHHLEAVWDLAEHQVRARLTVS